MDIIYESQKLLEDAGYWTSRFDEKNTLIFEDETLVGFIKSCETASEILTSWETFQDSFLARHASAFRAVPTKAWNIYSIFLAGSDCPEAELSCLTKIEEDFRGTRKIVRASVGSTDALCAALFPLLPVKNAITIDDSTSAARLDERLSFLSQAERESLLSKTPAAATVDFLLNQA